MDDIGQDGDSKFPDSLLFPTDMSLRGWAAVYQQLLDGWPYSKGHEQPGTRYLSGHPSRPSMSLVLSQQYHTRSRLASVLQLTKDYVYLTATHQSQLCIYGSIRDSFVEIGE
jgi:hypothetical protein